MAPTTLDGVRERPEAPRRAYVSPELVEWGTVEELTLGDFAGGTTDPDGYTGTVT